MNKYVEEGIRNIIFDLGKVLLDFDWEGYLRSYGYDDKIYEILADAIFRNPDWETGDEGIVTPSEWEELFVENAPAYETEVRRVFAGIRETISQAAYAKDWISYFKDRGYKLYYLSNYSEKLHNDTKEHMDFLEQFDGGIFSYEVKCIKPDLKIYKLLLEKYTLEPSETLFFDDRKVNVDAARQLGIKGKIFTPDIALDMLNGV